MKFNNTGCSYSYDLFKTLEKAQASCKNDNQCKGVLNDFCDVNEKYYLCSKNSTLKTDSSIESCFFRKVIIGKLLSKCNLMVFSDKSLIKLTNYITLKFRNISNIAVYLEMFRYGIKFHPCA